MNREEHQAWLAELATEDGRRRRQAEPELVRREAALIAARAELEKTKAGARELEAELEAERRLADGRSDG